MLSYFQFQIDLFTYFWNTQANFISHNFQKQVAKKCALPVVEGFKKIFMNEYSNWWKISNLHITHDIRVSSVKIVEICWAPFGDTWSFFWHRSRFFRRSCAFLLLISQLPRANFWPTSTIIRITRVRVSIRIWNKSENYDVQSGTHNTFLY